MDETKFDKFAQEYNELHQSVIGFSGENIDFFAEYKVKDTARCIREYGYPQDLSILDFGSGIGGSVPYFLKYLPQCQLTCLDVSSKSLDIGKDKYKDKARFLHFNGNQIPLDDESFHVVFTACVFHHIPHESHQKILEKIYRIMKPGGLFVAFEHNPYNFMTLRTVNACPFDENAVLIRGKEFQSLLQNSGFISKTLRYRLFFPRTLRFLRPFEKFMSRIPLGAQYYVTAQKPA